MNVRVMPNFLSQYSARAAAVSSRTPLNCSCAPGFRAMTASRLRVSPEGRTGRPPEAAPREEASADTNTDSLTLGAGGDEDGVATR